LPIIYINMINLFFFLKFKSQLRRTRPDNVRKNDEILTRAIIDAGGKITSGRSVISAVFNENTIGFWLDIYILIENLKKNMDASKEFFGYSLVITQKNPDSPELLCRFLANCGGIFLDSQAVRRFIPYAVFERPSQWQNDKNTHKYGSGSFFRISELKVFKQVEYYNQNSKNDIIRILALEHEKNILILGKVYLQIHSGLHSYCKKLNGDFPALTICFDSVGLGALIDAWSPSIRSLSNAPANDINSLWESLFRDRIRDEVSDYTVRNIKRFLSLLLEFYFIAARKKKRTPVLVLENINLAGKMVTELLLESLAEVDIRERNRLLILGTSEDDIQEKKLQQWQAVFSGVVNIKPDDQKLLYPRLSIELWEIVYAIALYGRYFSPELFQKLFEEDEKNTVMISRAFFILHTLGVIDNPHEPRLLNRNLEDRAFSILGEKAVSIKNSVCGRLLNWAVRRNINPCFRLLTIIAGLDGTRHIDNLLLLKSISSDIINGTVTGLEQAARCGLLEELFSEQKADAIRYIYKTSNALHTGYENEINEIFQEPVKFSKFEALPVLNAQIIVNHCGYYLAKRDMKTAFAKAKEAILQGQNKNTFCLPQAYRLFSLVSLSKHQIAETIEYLNFALVNAEKIGNYHEMGISAYYAAAAQVLYGDMHKAQRLAQKSIEQSLSAGCAEWADRSRFLHGRINFELGYYRKAHDIFEALRKDPYGSISEEKDSLLAAWIYRSQIYYLDQAIPKPEPANFDADLFEIEASYLAGDYEKTVRLSRALVNPFSGDQYLYTERPDWRSGFTQCEHLYFSQGEIQDRMICIFRSLALSCMSEEDGQKALVDIEQLLREERLCEMDLWDTFYYYAKYRILEQTGANHVDMSTAVSMAFKRLQRRASRIEDIDTRRQYLNGPRWNRELCVVAKDFKLI